MPTAVGPNTKGEENLVFGYDLGDVSNSYKGEPTLNYIPGSFNYSLYAYASGPVDTTVLNEENKSITAKRYTITSAVNTARAAIFPSGLTTGVAYTFSFKWKYNGTTTSSPSIQISAYKGYPEGGANNNGLTSEISSTVSIGNGWYLTTYTFVFSSNPTGGSILTFGIYTGSTSSYVGETFDVYEAQFEIKGHKTQYANGTRSATQGLLDHTGNSTIDLTNVSFDSNAQMTFDGTNDYMSIAGAGISDYSQPFTMECIFMVDPAATWDNGYRSNIFSINGAYAGMYGLFKDNNTDVGIQLRDADSTTYAVATNLSKGVYYHLVGTSNGSGTVSLYLNGVLAQDSIGTLTGAPDSQNLFIGGSRAFGGAYGNHYQGEIPVAKYYNRALTASEVQSNFNAIKGRFNI